ncbi:MAG TPA: c-type cytochrome [Terriglobales bacterium]|jgi:mono/diheme cytochrome c family protein
MALIASPMYLAAQFPNPVVIPPAASQGEQLFIAACASCHGNDARGAANGPDLIRSKLVLTDRMEQLHGVDFLAVLKKPPHPSANFTPAQLFDISQFLTQAVDKTLRSGYSNQPTHLLSGDPKAGAAFFNGAGGCSGCHSVTGDLAGIGARMQPAVLQQRWVFPMAGNFRRGGRGRGRAPEPGRGAAGPNPPPAAAATKVTVTPVSGAPVTGTLVRVDDFGVTLSDASGEHTYQRAPGVQVKISNPYAAHIELLDHLTDTDIHNMTTYLESLK